MKVMPKKLPEHRIARGETIFEVIFSDAKPAPEPHLTIAFLEAIAKFMREHPKPLYIGAIQFDRADEEQWYVYFHELEV